MRKYIPGKAQFNGLVMSAAGASIRCLAVDPSGKRVAVASECVYTCISCCVY